MRPEGVIADEDGNRRADISDPGIGSRVDRELLAEGDVWCLLEHFQVLPRSTGLCRGGRMNEDPEEEEEQQERRGSPH